MGKIVCLLLALISFQVGLHAQDVSATDFHSTTDFSGSPQINSTSGTLTYSLKLFDIQSKGIHIPITLNYVGGSGVEVFSEASWVGQGWELSAGGKIRRIQNGPPDDVELYFYSPIPNIQAASMIGNLNVGFFVPSMFNETFLDSENSSAAAFSNGIYDRKPDFFDIQVNNGFSGMFALRGGATKLTPLMNETSHYGYVDLNKSINDLTFSTNSNGRINRFSILSPEGIKYNFHEEEEVFLPEHYEVVNLKYSNLWNLTSILNQYKEIAFEFQYTDPYELDYSSFGFSSTRSRESAGSSGSSKKSDSKIYQKFIQRIDYDGGYILFELDNQERIDLPGHYSLKSVKHFTDESTNPLAEYRFNYVYKGMDDMPEANFKRLFLSHIDFYLDGENIPSKGVFLEYDETQLPGKNSPAMDYWGYYNGGAEIDPDLTLDNKIDINPALRAKPSTPFSGLDLGIKGYKTLGGNAKREPEPEFAKAGVLQAVHYNSGRSERFEYELNEYSEIRNPFETVQIEGQSDEPDLIFYPETIGPLWSNVIQFGNIVDHAQWVRIEYNKNNSCVGTMPPFEDDVVLRNYYWIPNQPTPLEGHSMLLEDGVSRWIYVEPYHEFTVGSENPNIPWICPTIGTPPNIKISGIKTHIANDKTSYRKDAGGLRISKIISSDNNGEKKAQIHNYDLFDNPLKSSGVIQMEPHGIFITGKCPTSAGPNYFYSLSGSRNTSSMLRANNVVYTNIETYTCLLDANDNCISETDSRNLIGKERQVFEFHGSDEPSAVGFPFIPSTKNQSRRIQLKQKESYDTENNLVSRSTFEYSFQEFENEKIFGAAIVPYQYHTNGQLQFYKNHVYSNHPEISRLLSKNDILYQDGNQVDATLTEYEYAGTGHFNPTQVTTTNAQGFKQIVRTKYTGDYESNTGANTSGAQAHAIRQFKENGIMGVPIEVSKYIQNPGEAEKLVEARISFYQPDTQESGVPKFLETKITELESPLPNYEMSDVEFDDSYVFVHDEPLFTLNLDKVTEYAGHLYPKETLSDYGDFSASLRSPVTNRELAAVSNGKHATSRHTSFEEADFHGGWDPDPAFITDSEGPGYGPAGLQYYKLTDASKFNSMAGDGTKLPSGKYLLSYWTADGEAEAHLGANAQVLKQSTVQRGDWTYREIEFEWTSEDNWITLDVDDADPDGTVYIDEVRLHELDAAMTSNGFYPDGKTMYESGAGGAVVNYEYDAKGRPEWVMDAERHVVKRFAYGEKDISDPDSYNVRHTYTIMRDDMTKDEVMNASPNNHDVKQRTEYSDGFGRFRQAVDWRVHPSSMSVVNFAEYDALGRQLKKHLPYVTSLLWNEGYIADAKTQQQAYYQNRWDPQEETDAPYSVTVVEKSPLQRPLEKGGVGEELQPGMGNTATVEYGYNTSSDQILVWKLVNGNATADWGFYAPGSLKKTSTTNAHGTVSVSYVDDRGRNVANAVTVNTGTDADGHLTTGPVGQLPQTQKTLVSYVIYDDFNRPVFEIPALAVERMQGDYLISGTASSGMIELVSHYVYDVKGRISFKRVPGKGKIEFVYDNRDRVILTQDPEQAASNRWSFVKYDTRGRVVLKGELTSTKDRAAHQGDADAYAGKGEVFSTSGTVFGYTNAAYPPVAEADVFNAYYFDDYAFGFPSHFSFAPFGDNSAATTMTRGLPTGSKTRVLPATGGMGDVLTTVSWYDDDRRPIQAFTENHLGGHDRIDTWYNERGAVDKTVQHHQYDASSDPHIFTTRFVYDVYSDAPVRTYCQLDDDPEILVSRREFDPDGKLRRLRLHRPPGMDDFMQNIDYRYNDQGQLTHINNTALIVDAFNPDDNDVFGQELTYFDDSPEYDSSDPSVKNPVKRYDGNVSSMMWNAKTPDQDGTMLSRHAYLYKYDGFGQMTEADYLSDTPASPGTFVDDPVIPEQFDERVNYDLGGNITRLNRSQIGQTQGGGYGQRMDELTYQYEKGYRLKAVQDAGIGVSNAYYRHFVDGSSQTEEYVYDASGRLLQDKNRGVSFQYNALDLPRMVRGKLEIDYLYDASANKLQKKVEIPECPPNEQCPGPMTLTTDYIGNFVYQNGALQMVYHPEGIIRPTPHSAENETEYVYDYFIKDYLGNVRVVLTEENATYDSSMVATMEEYRANWEEANFENIEEGREPVPFNYPVDASFPFNQFIAKLVADNEMTIGPAKVLEVNQGDKVKLATQYFYEKDAPGTAYENLGFLVEEILVSMAAAGAGVLPVGEGTLVNLATGSTNLGNHIANFLSNTMDTTGMDRPHGYLVWLAYDKDFKLDPTSSGALRVEDPNELGTLMSGEFPVNKPGYLHVYVANGTASKIINFDNLYVTTMQGQTRQINHYYPYGLRMRMGQGKRYINMYTGKELQTGEFWDASVSTGLEMYDFGSRFYDPQLGRWFTPDPAEQFANPYLAMGNNPVVYVDPDGELAVVTALLVGAAIAAATYTTSVALSEDGFDNWDWGQFGKSVGIGAISGVVTAGIGSVFGGVGGMTSVGLNIAKEATRAMAHGTASTLIQAAFGNDPDASTYAVGALSSLVGSATHNFGDVAQIGVSTVTGGATAHFTGGDWLTGAANGAIVAGLNHVRHSIKSQQDPPKDVVWQTKDGNYMNIKTGEVFDSNGCLLYTYPVGGRIDQNYTLEGILIPIAKAPAAIRSLKIGYELASRSAFRAAGKAIENYAPSLNRGPGIRIGLSKSHGRQVFRMTHGNRHNHYFDIDLGPIPRIKN